MSQSYINVVFQYLVGDSQNNVDDDEIEHITLVQIFKLRVTSQNSDALPGTHFLKY